MKWLISLILKRSLKREGVHKLKKYRVTYSVVIEAEDRDEAKTKFADKVADIEIDVVAEAVRIG